MKACEEAIKSMKNDKSLGLDWILIYFYKLFWNEIKTYFYDSFFKSVIVEELTTTQRVALISLMHKKI